MPSWEIVEASQAPVADVWALLADARGWSRWARFARSELERQGSPDPDGVGALRVFGSGPFKSYEEVVGFEPPHHLAYEIRKGMPIDGYHADVHLEPVAGGGTTIRWSSSFGHARAARARRLLPLVPARVPPRHRPPPRARRGATRRRRDRVAVAHRVLAGRRVRTPLGEPDRQCGGCEHHREHQ